MCCSGFIEEVKIFGYLNIGDTEGAGRNLGAVNADVDECLGNIDWFCCAQVSNVKIDIDDPFDFRVVPEFLIVFMKRYAWWTDNVARKKRNRIFFK